MKGGFSVEIEWDLNGIYRKRYPRQIFPDWTVHASSLGTAPPLRKVHNRGGKDCPVSSLPPWYYHKAGRPMTGT